MPSASAAAQGLGGSRKEERKAFHLISKMAGLVVYLNEEVIYDF